MNLLQSGKLIAGPMLKLIQHQRILNASTPVVVTTAGLKDLPEPEEEKVVGFPEQNRLRLMPKQPTYPPGLLTPKMPKRMSDYRGPELIHNKLIHRQYGIVALSGGELEHGHFEMIRTTINRHLDLKKSFAIWRVDPPWKAVSRHGQGKKLGGGKGAISHYVTPIKRGRLIVEVGGYVPARLVTRGLIDVAQKLPFPARAVSQQDLEEWEQTEEKLKKENNNKLRWEWCVKNNILNSINYLSPYDLEFAHLGPDCR